LKTTTILELINVYDLEELFDEIYDIFKRKMDKDGRPDADVGVRATAPPKFVKTIIDGKLVGVDLNIAISCGDLGLAMKDCPGDKGTSLLNTRETKKKEGRIVSTFIKGRLQKINLDSIEAKEQQMKLLDGD